ncbi:DUF4442 domain-containing protein [Nonlabens sp.]|uniref:DUF4442 domain-containing protein n=1 Tax=Nonlabens sp. TaxID=1888209 RepID=UPI0025E2A79C|nr:DUF4442 domain-containing protein [Nonlabens sp.]
MYHKLYEWGTRLLSESTLFKFGLNWSPMYRRSTAKITFVSTDLLQVKMKLPISWRNKNYMNSIFGGSMYAAVDPIPMFQLINIIGDEYVVWDKAARIKFKKPAKENLYAEFLYSEKEVTEIKQLVERDKEIEIVKLVELTNKSGTQVYCEIEKVIYVANKEFYKNKRLGEQKGCKRINGMPLQ